MSRVPAHPCCCAVLPCREHLACLCCCHFLFTLTTTHSAARSRRAFSVPVGARVACAWVGAGGVAFSRRTGPGSTQGKPRPPKPRTQTRGGACVTAAASLRWPNACAGILAYAALHLANLCMEPVQGRPVASPGHSHRAKARLGARARREQGRRVLRWRPHRSASTRARAARESPKLCVHRVQGRPVASPGHSHRAESRLGARARRKRGGRVLRWRPQGNARTHARAAPVSACVRGECACWAALQ